MTTEYRTEEPEEARSSGRRRSPVWLTVLLDLIAPTALFYLLRTAGVRTFPALLAGCVVPAVNAAVQALGHRRIETLAITMLVLLLVSAVGSVVVGSPRLLLAKDATLTGVWGACFFVSLRTHRPLTFRLSRPLLEGHRVIDTQSWHWVAPTTRSWEDLWQQTPHFRRVWNVSTGIWGTALLFDAALRLVMAATLPLQVVPALAAALWIVTLVLLQIITNVYFWKAGLWTMLKSKPAANAPP